MEIRKELLDELIKDYNKPEDLIGETGLLKQLTKALLERAMKAELTHHLGYEKHDPAEYHRCNWRNGTTAKNVKGEFGEIRIETPRDRNGSFEPQIVQKHQTRFDGFDDKIQSLYARGLTTREIQGHLQEIYGVEVSPTLVSEVTDGILEEVKAWQNRPLEPLYSILFLDALFVKMRHEGRVENRAVYVAMALFLYGAGRSAENNRRHGDGRRGVKGNRVYADCSRRRRDDLGGRQFGVPGTNQDHRPSTTLVATIGAAA